MRYLALIQAISNGRVKRDRIQWMMGLGIESENLKLIFLYFMSLSAQSSFLPEKVQIL